MVTNLQVTDIEISQDQLWATAWVVNYDSQIEALLPTEPALAVAHYVEDDWQVFLTSDPGWQKSVYRFLMICFQKMRKICGWR